MRNPAAPLPLPPELPPPAPNLIAAAARSNYEHHKHMDLADELPDAGAIPVVLVFEREA